MKKFIIGKKIGMTQILAKDGTVEPITVVQAGPCVVLDLKTQSKQGYDAVMLGYQDLDLKKCNKAQEGFFKKASSRPMKYLKEFRVDNLDSFVVNQEVTVNFFNVSDKVSVRSKSIGHGFTGTIKRHNFSRGPMTHGSKSHRLPGSIGSGTTPGNVVKGKKMAGHYGDEFITVKNLTIVGIDEAKNCLFIKGSIPGKKNNLVEVFVK